MKDNHNLSKYIRNISNFPKEGIEFKDITTLLNDRKAFSKTIDIFQWYLRNNDIDKIVAPESRGFVLGSALACQMYKGFIPVRKPGKLPYYTVSCTYSLEYGIDSLEMHTDSISKGENVVIVDDLIATGGTLDAMIKLVNSLSGNVVKVLSLIDLPNLGGSELIKTKYNVPVVSLISYD